MKPQHHLPRHEICKGCKRIIIFIMLYSISLASQIIGVNGQVPCPSVRSASMTPKFSRMLDGRTDKNSISPAPLQPLFQLVYLIWIYYYSNLKLGLNWKTKTVQSQGMNAWVLKYQCWNSTTVLSIHNRNRNLTMKNNGNYYSWISIPHIHATYFPISFGIILSLACRKYSANAE